MYIKIDEDKNIIMMTSESFDGAVIAPEPNEDVIKWFAVGKYKFVDGEYVEQGGWVKPEVNSEDV